MLNKQWLKENLKEKVILFLKSAALLIIRENAEKNIIAWLNDNRVGLTYEPSEIASL